MTLARVPIPITQHPRPHGDYTEDRMWEDPSGEEDEVDIALHPGCNNDITPAGAGGMCPHIHACQSVTSLGRKSATVCRVRES